MLTKSITILIIDDDEIDRENYRRMLEHSTVFRCEIVEAANAKNALLKLNESTVDCILLDYQLPDMDGIKLLKQIKNEYGKFIPVIMLTGHGSEDIAVNAMKAGAIDYIVKSNLYPDILVKTIVNSIKTLQLKKIIEQQQEQIKFYTYYDSLTGLNNRHTFEEMAKQAFVNIESHHEMMALLFIDLDNFMTINDTLGQLAGDEILIETGKRLKEALPKEAIIGRWGDDEFAVLLLGTEIEHRAENSANKIIKAIKQPFSVSMDIVNISASIGIACYPSNSSDLAKLLKNAYTALTRAKLLGRGIILNYARDMDFGR